MQATRHLTIGRHSCRSPAPTALTPWTCLALNTSAAVPYRLHPVVAQMRHQYQGGPKCRAHEHADPKLDPFKSVSHV